MDKYDYDFTKLENQICFPMYVASKEIIRHYRPFLKALDLTYTQYITLMVLDDEEKICVKDLGKKLFLDSGTLTPVLKNMETKGLVRRYRSTSDERVLFLEITEKGREKKAQAKDIPQKVSDTIQFEKKDAEEMHRLLQIMTAVLKENIPQKE